MRCAALKKQLDIPATIKEVRVLRTQRSLRSGSADAAVSPAQIVGADKEAAYMAALDTLAENAWDDQCTGANPRYPLVKDLRGIFLAAWTRPILPLKSLEHYTPAAHASNN
jgi:alcohol dehydrogenase class IV